MISRSDPPPALIRLRANHQMEILGWDKLRLTLEESEGIIRLRAQEKQTKETISLLHKAADGWAAGLVLMLESVERKVIEPQALGKLTPDEIMDYFGKELFGKTDAEVQSFLLKTAFLPKMTPKMAEDLTGLLNARRILDTLSRTHYFTEKRFHGESVYQYHQLLREFLLSRAKDTLSHENQSILLHRAAILLEDSGQTEEAVALFREAGRWDEMVELIRKHARFMLEQGRNRSLAEWLESLPREILEANPWLLYWMGECHAPFDHQLCQFYFEKAFEKFRTEGAGVGIFLAWSGIVNSIMDVKESWALSMNERLKTKFIFYISKLGDHWQKAGLWEKAVKCYLRGLEIDDLSEEFYRALMVCYQKLDRRAEAIAVFRRCQRILSNTLHIEPSAKTQSIYKALVSEKQGSGEPAPLS